MRYVVLYPITGLPCGKVYGGETVDLDDATAAPLVGVAALRPVQEEPTLDEEEVITASPLAQGDEPAETTGTAAKKAPAKASRKK